MHRRVPVHSSAPAHDGACSLLFCTLPSSCSGAGRPARAAAGMRPAPAVLLLARGTRAVRRRGTAHGWTGAVSF